MTPACYSSVRHNAHTHTHRHIHQHTEDHIHLLKFSHASDPACRLHAHTCCSKPMGSVIRRGNMVAGLALYKLHACMLALQLAKCVRHSQDFLKLPSSCIVFTLQIFTSRCSCNSANSPVLVRCSSCAPCRSMIVPAPLVPFADP